MPARIVLVHDDPEFSEPVLAKLRAAGYDVVAFSNSMAAIAVLEHPRLIELLITRVRFPAGTPNGAALARMARLKRPGIKVLFTSFPEVQQHTEGLGEFLARPISDDLRAKALRARLHAVTLSDHDTAGRLLAYADELEAEARALELDDE